MPITPYALNVKGMDFGQSVNMLNAVRQMQAQNQQREMNALAMQKAQRDMEESEALRNALSTSDFRTPEGQAAIGKTGSKGISMLKDIAALQSSQTAQDLNKEKLIKATDERYRREASTIKTSDDMRKHLTKMWNDPVFGGHLSGFSSLDEALADIPTDPAQFEKFKNYFVGGPQAVVQDMKAKATADAAKQSQEEAMRRTVVGQQMQAAADTLNRGLRFDEQAGSYVLNPGYTSDQIRKARETLSRFVEGTIPGDNPAMNLPLPAGGPAPTPTNLPADLKTPIETAPLATGGEIPTRVAPPPGAPGAQPIPNPPAAATALPGVISTQEELQDARAAGAAKETAAKIQAKTIELEPQSRSQVVSVADQTANMINSIDRVLADPQLNKVTGNWAGTGVMKGLNSLLSQASADVNSDINRLSDQTFIESIKDGSAKGLTPISNEEGIKIQRAKANLDQQQSPLQFRKALLNLKAQIIRSVNTIIGEYNTRHEKLKIQGWQPAGYKLPDAAVQKLLKDPSKDAQKEFDELFGEGTADYVLKGQSNGK